MEYTLQIRLPYSHLDSLNSLFRILGMSVLSLLPEYKSACFPTTYNGTGEPVCDLVVHPTHAFLFNNATASTAKGSSLA